MKGFAKIFLFCCILSILHAGCKPGVRIISPRNGHTFAVDELITFAGKAADLQHPNLDDAAFVWTSDKDGEIGTGPSFTSSDLSEGKHTITLTVTDPDNQTGHRSVRITVGNGGVSTTTTTTTGLTTTSTISTTTTSGSTTTTTGPGDLDTVQSIYDTLVSIPSGTFQMGCSTGDTSCYSDELPQHTVTISSGFKMSAYEITQGQWQAVMGSNPSYFTSCGSDCPVEQVSWTSIQTFITTLNSLTGRNYRLPTEAEWEYAARAGTTTKYYCGDDESCLGSIAWYDSNAGNMTHPAGEKTPNSFGLYDMSGNVVEWVNDWYGNYSSGSFIDPQGPPTGSNRVLRGGGWYGYGFDCRSSNRINIPPGHSDSNLGFRLCLP